VGGTATISLAGTFTADSVPALQEQVAAATKRKATAIIFDAEDLESISEEGLRALAFLKQKLGSSFDITLVGASDTVREAIAESGLTDEITLGDLAAV
jgi:anti-anti-sigma factor